MGKPIDNTNKIGIEIEIRGVSPEITNIFTRNPNINITTFDDGSIRTSTFTVNNVPIITRGLDIKNVQRILYGCEIQTPPMDDITADLFIDAATDILEEVEEYTDSTSVHIHLDTKDWTYRRLYNLTRWWYALEGAVYRIASFGTIHRGVRNNFKYARPLAYPIGYNATPQQRRSEIVPIINTTELLTAKSFSEYLYHWGRMDYLWSRRQHYIPQRLHGLNITSMQRIGTVEFRVFNGHYTYLKYMKNIVRTFEYLSTQDIDTNFLVMSGCQFFVPRENINTDLVKEVFGEEYIEFLDTDLPTCLPVTEHHYSSYTHVTNERPVRVKNRLDVTDTGNFEFLICY